MKHLSQRLGEPTPQGATEGGALDTLTEDFPVLVLSCLQLSSKLSFLGQVSPACSSFDKPPQPFSVYYSKPPFQRIDSDTAVRFLQSVGHSVSKQALLESELTVLKVLEFRINDPNPLTYVEVLLEVLGKTYLNSFYT